MFLFVPSLPAVPSVVKKDTMPTDVPKGTWPFSADSDSSWTQLRAAWGAPCWGPPWAIPGSVFNCFTPALVRLWLELVGRHTGVYSYGLRLVSIPILL